MTVRISLNLGNKEILLSPEEAHTVLSIFNGKEVIRTSYEKDDAGVYRNVYLLENYDSRQDVSTKVLIDEEYNALKFFTAARLAAKASV